MLYFIGLNLVKNDVKLQIKEQAPLKLHFRGLQQLNANSLVVLRLNKESVQMTWPGCYYYCIDIRRVLLDGNGQVK